MPVFPIYLYFLAASFMVSLLVFFTNRFPERYLKWFSIFLFATLTAEVTGNFLDVNGRANVHIYNYFTAFEFSCYLLIIRAMVNNVFARKMLLVAALIYFPATSLYIYYILPPLYFHAITYSMGCLLVVIATVYFFLELFRTPRSISLLRQPSFWICTALLFFYCSSFPLYGLVNFWAENSPIIIQNFGLIMSILNVFLYFLFSIAFLCRMISPKYIS